MMSVPSHPSFIVILYSKTKINFLRINGVPEDTTFQFEKFNLSVDHLTSTKHEVPSPSGVTGVCVVFISLTHVKSSKS